MIVEAYVSSVQGILLPLHGCWVNPTPLNDVEDSVISAFEYVF